MAPAARIGRDTSDHSFMRGNESTLIDRQAITMRTDTLTGHFKSEADTCTHPLSLPPFRSIGIPIHMLNSMQMTVLEKQLSFLREIDRLKSIVRQSPLLDKSRKENSAEHSWHLAMYALLLSEYASGPVNTNRVIQMLLLHDIVEIDAGDFPIHGTPSSALQAEQESRAAARLFGLLPQPQGNDLLALWQEFERAETEDAKFAKALDRFQPLLVNVVTGGGTWTENSVSLEQVFSRYGPVIKRGAPLLWSVCEQWVSRHFAGQAPGTTKQSG